MVYVPHKLVVTQEKTYQTPLGQKMLEFGDYKDYWSKSITMPKWAFFGLFLLQEVKRGEDSEFAAFIDIMPRGFDDYPVNFTDDELAMLEGSPVLEEITDRIGMFNADYKFLC